MTIYKLRKKSNSLQNFSLPDCCFLGTFFGLKATSSQMQTEAESKLQGGCLRLIVDWNFPENSCRRKHELEALQEFPGIAVGA